MSDAEQGFDAILERLRAVVGKLEAGSLGLEESLLVFEEGVKLSRTGAAILDAAEQRVEVLTRASDGSEHVAPLDTRRADSDEGSR